MTGTRRTGASRSTRRRADGGTRRFQFGIVLRRIRNHLRETSLAAAAMFELAERGHRTLFEQLVGCMISIRTLDEVSLPTALGLFARARTPAAVAAMGVARIDALIHACSFHRTKAEQIHAMARRAVDELGGRLPPDGEVLMSFKGVGPKCANLALGVACGMAAIGVDIHVHRVTNRWGAVSARTPEQTMAALERVLPKRYWIEINRLLVPFGKHVCTAVRPKCSTCPVLEYCRQVGVTSHR
ncbi:MAG: endonuclease III domain-containing protein [Gemmatimonadales bacterium]